MTVVGMRRLIAMVSLLLSVQGVFAIEFTVYNATGEEE